MNLFALCTSRSFLRVWFWNTLFLFIPLFTLWDVRSCVFCFLKELKRFPILELLQSRQEITNLCFMHRRNNNSTSRQTCTYFCNFNLFIYSYTLFYVHVICFAGIKAEHRDVFCNLSEMLVLNVTNHPNIWITFALTLHRLFAT